MKITLGITGSISAYKSTYILREFVKRGEEVYCVMTSGAKHFVSPLTLSVLSRHKVYDDPFIRGESVLHVTLASNDLVLIAPATYNIIGKISAGIADDLLTSVVAATKNPVVIAPSMNPNMYNNKFLQQNLRRLREIGFFIIEPEKGEVACGDDGLGRLAEPEKIVDYVYGLINRKSTLMGTRVLVTTGRTEERIDPVRVITNRSSGRMGYEIAREAETRGAKVTIIRGATDIPITEGIRVHDSKEMEDKLSELIGENDILIMAAAVSDFKPLKKSSKKIRRREGKLTLELQNTDDLIKKARILGKDRLIIGFSVGGEDLIGTSKIKLREKSLDMIVANHYSVIGSGFTSFSIIDKSNRVKGYPEMSKKEAARVILDRVERLWKKR